MHSLIFCSKRFLYISTSSSFVEEGIIIGSPQTNLHLENGYVIRNESQDLSLKFLSEAKPSGIIGTWEWMAIFITPSDTFLFGPLGPSGVIPT